MPLRSAQASVLDLRPNHDLDDDTTDLELLVTLTGQGESMREARTRAMALLDEAGGIHGLRTLSRSQLESFGLSNASIQRLRAALRLGVRATARPPPATPLTAQAVAAIFHPLLDHLPHEEMHVVMLDARRRFRQRRRIASGGVAACSVFVKDLLAPVVEARAYGMVLVHNHPSGASQPSPEDFSLTTRVQQAAETLGVWVIDHLVIAEDGHSSAMPGGGRWNTRPYSRAI